MAVPDKAALLKMTGLRPISLSVLLPPFSVSSKREMLIGGVTGMVAATEFPTEMENAED